jgi:glycosyltransferase involved in cell wall biosynthesis
MRYCVIIPAHNEERTIGTLVAKVLDKKLDVIVVNDGSIDRTARIIKDLHINIITNNPKQGKGGSLQKGFALAVEKGYDGVITLDGDGQHDVEDLNKFVEAADRRQGDVIIGSRMADHRSMPFVRYCTNRFMSFLISKACGQKVPDSQCGYRFISTEVLKNIRLSCSGFEVESEIIMKAARAGYRIGSVDIRTIYADEKSKINPIKDTIRFFKYFLAEINAK